MYLTEIHNITKTNRNWKQCDLLCFQSKNLYNACLYRIIKHKEETGKFLRYLDMEKLMRSEHNSDYFSISATSSQQILRSLDTNLKSYFNSLKAFKKDKTKFKGLPKFPKYKHKTKGRNVFILRADTVRYKDGYLHFPKKCNLEPIKTTVPKDSKLGDCRIVPTSGCYKIEIVYEKKEKPKIKSNKVLAIDLGVNNLFTCTTNFDKAFIINGKPLKSINQYYNKKGEQLKSKLKKNHDKHTSKRLQRLNMKRNNKIKDYLHKSTRIIVNYCKNNDVSKVIIGYNKNWKQNSNMSKQNNQNFVSIPFNTGINQLKYKLELEGIEFREINEAYTSKCSAIDYEPIQKHDNYLGKRIKRGLFKTKNGILINSDINGSLNILRKATNDVLAKEPISRGLGHNPVKVSLHKVSILF